MSWPAIEESEHDVGSLEQLEVSANEYYLAGKLPLADHLRKIPGEVKECHQHNASLLRFHVSQLEGTGYDNLWPTSHCTCCAGSVMHDSVGRFVR